MGQASVVLKGTCERGQNRSPLYDRYVEPTAQFHEDFFEPWFYLFDEHVVPVYRYPYEMVLATVDRM